MNFFFFPLQKNHTSDTEEDQRAETPTTDCENLPEAQDDAEQLNGKVVKSNSEAQLSSSSGVKRLSSSPA